MSGKESPTDKERISRLEQENARLVKENANLVAENAKLVAKNPPPSFKGRKREFGREQEREF